ncbi:c-type cytochrome [Zoogloea sp.]|uniref:c-type cytochrome n=1 Tax=Zoogloea sp. TaxID=49181 RepID=UPI002D1FB2AF|nr:c-type cytochrome [Zoogloea sp.]
MSLAGMVGVVSAEGESDPTLARNLAATCANCHGTDGRAQPGPGMDALAGGDADRMMQKLRDFRSGARPATIMHQISRGYTEAQLQLIAAYFAARK